MVSYKFITLPDITLMSSLRYSRLLAVRDDVVFTEVNSNGIIPFIVSLVYATTGLNKRQPIKIKAENSQSKALVKL